MVILVFGIVLPKKYTGILNLLRSPASAGANFASWSDRVLQAQRIPFREQISLTENFPETSSVKHPLCPLPHQQGSSVCSESDTVGLKEVLLLEFFQRSNIEHIRFHVLIHCCIDLKHILNTGGPDVHFNSCKNGTRRGDGQTLTSSGCLVALRLQRTTLLCHVAFRLAAPVSRSWMVLSSQSWCCEVCAQRCDVFTFCTYLSRRANVTAAIHYSWDSPLNIGF